MSIDVADRTISGEQTEPPRRGADDRPRKLYVADASVSASALERRLAVMVSDSDDPKKRETVAAVSELTQRVHAAATGQSPRTTWLSRTCKGALIEAAYLNYHAARVVAVEALEQADLRAELPGAVARTRRYLDRDDPRRAQAERLLQSRGELNAAEVGRVLESGYEAADNHHRAIRGFRNIIYISLAGIMLLLAVVAALVTVKPDLLPLCFSPEEAAQETVAVEATTTAETADIPTDKASSLQFYCPTGSGQGRAPSPFDIWVVLGMGTIGGGLASMVAIRGMTASTTPYDVPVALSRLKVPAGALTALIGLVAIRGGFVPGLSELDSQQQIIAYALVFGYAQQLATSFLDQRAAKLQETDVTPLTPSTWHEDGSGPVAGDAEKASASSGTDSTPAPTDER